MQSRRIPGLEKWWSQVYFYYFAFFKSNVSSPQISPLHCSLLPFWGHSSPIFRLIKKSKPQTSICPRSSAEVISVSSKILDFSLACIYYAQMQKENYSSFAIKISLALQAPAFRRLIMPSSLLLRASVYSSANYFCSQLTKINDGINIYWRSLREQYASPEEGWVLFPSGKATQQTGLRVICCGAYR